MICFIVQKCLKYGPGRTAIFSSIVAVTSLFDPKRFPSTNFFVWESDESQEPKMENMVDVSAICTSKPCTPLAMVHCPNGR